ncbi:MAG: 3-deoxy-8-phosphooctulonate synthase [Candidatus Aminicenantes bacterium]
MTTAPKEIKLFPDVRLGGSSFFLIAGPCVIESREHALGMAGRLQSVCRDLEVPFIFKASFDKANRSSIDSFRGPGMEAGLEILSEIRTQHQLPVTSDVHEPRQVEKVSEVLDIIQIPAFLSRQTDLVMEAARSGKPVNIKKGPFLSPYDMKNVLGKALSQNNRRIILTERGTSFGYNNLVFDVRSIPIMKKWGYPVVIDASHSVQKPGGQGPFSGGDAEFIPHIARAGISVGADGIFLETHDRPDKALSDKHNSLNLNKLKELLQVLIRIRSAVSQRETSSGY